MPPIWHPNLTVIRDYSPGQFFTLTYIAHKCGVKYRAFNRALRNGVIPWPRYTNTLGHLMFTFHQMELVIHTYRAWRRHEIKRCDIRPILDAEWDK